MTPGRAEYTNYLNQVQSTAEAHGMAEAYARFHLFREFSRQVAMLAYNEAFFLIGFLSLAAVPFCFLLSPNNLNMKPRTGGH
ncbi:hypothetical protein LOC54_04725 [Acetobacter sp. AN02]|uniref:hypothetical protein n=1 Tax=Acetobacter sp. AN02 TaxID=2894186 RepID=UPI0024344ABF|nr:hypothetical protein [Acetobacter sp. AN02]MDG6094423.1 hypothetical protein [Acetobacter sp. AN02]